MMDDRLKRSMYQIAEMCLPKMCLEEEPRKSLRGCLHGVVCGYYRHIPRSLSDWRQTALFIRMLVDEFFVEAA